MNHFKFKMTDMQMDEVCDLWDSEEPCRLCGGNFTDTDGIRTKAFFAQLGGPRSTFPKQFDVIAVCPDCTIAMAKTLADRKALRTSVAPQ